MSALAPTDDRRLVLIEAEELEAIIADRINAAVTEAMRAVTTQRHEWVDAEGLAKHMGWTTRTVRELVKTGAINHIMLDSLRTARFDLFDLYPKESSNG